MVGPAGMRAVAAAAALVALAGCAEEVPGRLRVTILGVDGAAWRVIDPMLARGELPNFRRLIEEGVRAPLLSERPIVSPPIWTTIATGQSRRRHGIRDFFNGRGELVSSRDRKQPALWTLASAAGIRSAVIGWWGTYPAESIDGVVISERAFKTRDADIRAFFGGGLGAPHLGRLAHPPEVLRMLAATLFEVERAGGELTEGERVAKRMRVEDAAVLRSLVELRDRAGPFGLEMALLRGVDPVSHFFWKFHEPEAAAYPEEERPTAAELERYGAAVEDHYRYVDSLLPELPARGGRDRVVLLLSDHGFEAGHQPFHSGAVLSGMHDSAAALYGILIASGGPFRRGARIYQASIYDIAPTALHLMGLPVLESLPGRVISDALDPDWLAGHPVRRVERADLPPVALPEDRGAAEADSPVDAQLREELRALGYIE